MSRTSICFEARSLPAHVRRTRSVGGEPPVIQGGEVCALHVDHHEIRVLGPCQHGLALLRVEVVSTLHPSTLPGDRSRIGCSRAWERSTVEVKGFIEVGHTSVKGVSGSIGAAGLTVAAAADPREEWVLGILLASFAVGRG